ncbi:MAG: BatA and WFA domain-containing protein [Deltaproteobacteria bacterium]|nr:BatA and WFA domain-containing protein [Deltaproteobacteria bacterium]
MTFLGPIPAATLAWVAGIAAALTISAYILKMRRRRFEVPFSALWKRVLDQKEPSSLWRHLKRLLSLFFLLCIAGLVLFAALDPTRGAANHDARNVVVLLDASASMKAIDGNDDKNDDKAANPGKTRTRLAVAKERAKLLIDSMGGGDLAMIMRMDGQTTPLGRFSSDGPMLRRLVDAVEATDTPADLHRALGAAADALRDRKNPLIVVISDGAFPVEQREQVRWQPAAPGEKDLAAIDLTGIDVRYVNVGHRKDNVGIVAFNVRRYVANKAAYEVFIELENFGDTATQRRVSLFDGDLELFAETDPGKSTLDLAPHTRVRKIYKDLPAGTTGHLRALATVPAGLAPDPFPLDDEAWALLPARKSQKVLMVTADNLYLEAAVLAYDNIVPSKITPAEYAANPAQASDYDTIIFDTWAPAEPPPKNAIYFRPDAAHSPVAISGELPRPHITDVDKSHPTMKWVTLSDVNIDTTHVFAPDASKGESVLASSVRDPIIVAKRDSGHKYLVFGFSLTGSDTDQVGSDLMLRVAFPLLLVNALDWFAGDDSDLITTYATGVRQRVPLDGAVGLREANLTAPDGVSQQKAPVLEGLATFYADRVGVWKLSAKFPDGSELPPLELAANLANPSESTIAPIADLTLGGRKLTEPEAFAITENQRLWIYLLLGVIALLGIEWVTYHRRITV